MTRKPTASKYRAVPTVVDGIRFASKKEARRYGELKLLLKGSQIESMDLQPRYECIVKGVKICDYVADFRYLQGENTIVEDVKGMKTPVYKLKKKLVEALYGITITEV